MAATYTKIGDILSAFWKRAKKVVDAGDAETLEAAKAYAKDYADTEIASSIATAIQTNVTDKFGVANGFATLDANGQIPASQLTISAMEFKGSWDASNNSPALADGTGNSGDFYIVTVASGESTHLGGGFLVNDRVIYDGSVGKWTRLVGDTVIGVNGQTGSVNLNASNLNYVEPVVYTIKEGDTASSTVTVDGKSYTLPTTIPAVGEKVTLKAATTISQKVDALESSMTDIAANAISIEDTDIDAMIGTVTSEVDGNEVITYVPDEIVASVTDNY